MTERPAARAAWRLIRDEPDDGAWNMAVDEALLESYEEAEAPLPPTLRLYGWRPAALSLGKSQAAAGAHDLAALRVAGVDLVRRPTGGEAVLHEHERTYALVGAPGTPPFPAGPVDTYRLIAEALVAALSRLGIEARSVEPSGRAPRRRGAICFERVGAWEIAVAGRKLVGSSQFRRRRSFLQHGSIPRRMSAARIAALTGAPVDAARFTDLESEAGRRFDDDEIDRALAFGFGTRFGVDLVPGSLTEAEALRAAELRCWKYDSRTWTLEGRLGARERRWGPAIAR